MTNKKTPELPPEPGEVGTPDFGVEGDADELDLDEDASLHLDDEQFGEYSDLDDEEDELEGRIGLPQEFAMIVDGLEDPEDDSDPVTYDAEEEFDPFGTHYTPEDEPDNDTHLRAGE